MTPTADTHTQWLCSSCILYILFYVGPVFRSVSVSHLGCRKCVVCLQQAAMLTLYTRVWHNVAIRSYNVAICTHYYICRVCMSRRGRRLTGAGKWHTHTHTHSHTHIYIYELSRRTQAITNGNTRQTGVVALVVFSFVSLRCVGLSCVALRCFAVNPAHSGEHSCRLLRNSAQEWFLSLSLLLLRNIVLFFGSVCRFPRGAPVHWQGHWQ